MGLSDWTETGVMFFYGPNGTFRTSDGGKTWIETQDCPHGFSREMIMRLLNEGEDG